MFCNKCGCRVKSEESICPNCGAKIENLEICGGFWGLVGEKPPVAIEAKLASGKTVTAHEREPVRNQSQEVRNAPVTPNAKVAHKEGVADTAPQKNAGSKKSTAKKKTSAWAYICIVLVLLAGIQTIRVVALNNKLDKASSSSSSMQTQISSMESSIGDLQNQIDTLTTEVNDLNTQLSTVEQDVSDVSDQNDKIIEMLTPDESSSETEISEESSEDGSDVSDIAENTQDENPDKNSGWFPFTQP